MIDTFLRYFIRNKPTKRHEDPQHIESLKETWEDLDTELRDFAITNRDIGLGQSLKICFNERGMAELVIQLGEIGYEIRKKEH